MNIIIYQSIIQRIQEHRGLSRDCLMILERSFPQTSRDTLYSILYFEYQKRMKANYNKSNYNINKYWTLYRQAVENGESPGIIVRLSEQFEICPCLVAKLILLKYFDEVVGENVSNGINQYVRDTTLIPDMDLAYETFLCTLYDNLYSPLSETLKQSLGQQYEIKLHKEVVKLGLAFRDEEHLRRYGYDKTPDVKLDVPVAIDGFIINWIESKALFGTAEVHEEYMKVQYLSYWNRFGPGLVIYWFGFLKNITEVSDNRFIISDHLPKKIVQLNEVSSVK